MIPVLVLFGLRNLDSHSEVNTKALNISDTVICYSRRRQNECGSGSATTTTGISEPYRQVFMSRFDESRGPPRHPKMGRLDDRRLVGILFVN